MDHVTLLLQRLEQIGASLAEMGKAYALLGLGSVGESRDRLDQYSDLDFFVIARPGYKRELIADLSWLSRIAPLGYAFLNSADGYKALYEDGVFCEFAVFEPDEMSAIPFAPGRIVWSAPDFDPRLAIPSPKFIAPKEHGTEWLIGEALTNLYVGLGRYRRGEKLSGAYFIQSFALARIVDLADRIETPQAGERDRFMGERRFEQRHPLIAAELSEMLGGYDRTIESARAILAFLERHFPINPHLRDAIRALL
ncbi:MAG: hypothetical protein MUF87_22440 [Anaerolineae bacterium]|jgi:hypothetical protein|nr:hypothetical protein [Anaerolineae bacterium]